MARRRRPRVPRSRVSRGTQHQAANQATHDPQRFWIYTQRPDGAMATDKLVYVGERLAKREADKITRVLGEYAEARPVPAWL